MSKTYNQKAKILYLEQMFLTLGEGRAVTMQEILERLLQSGIRAERKSVYDDLEALRQCGLEVRFKRGRPGGYYLASREGFYKNLSCSPEREKAPEKEKEAKKEPAVFQAKAAKEEQKPVKLLYEKQQKEAVEAYLGKTAQYKEKEDGQLQASARIELDAGFYGWLTMMGNQVKLVKPKKAAAAYKEYLKSIMREYKGI